LVEDNDFFTKENIKLSFPLLKKPPLFNYAKFVTILNLNMTEYLNKLMYLKYKDESLRDRLIRFIINHSSIKYLNTSFLRAKLIIGHPDFHVCFQKLEEFETTDDYSPNFFNKLSSVCDNIQSFRLHFNNVNKDNEELANLIKKQNRVKKIFSYLSTSNRNSGLNLKDAITNHSNSMIEYHSTGFSHADLAILQFKNLTSLHLENSKVNKIDVPEKFKSISFPNLQKVTLKNFKGKLLSNVSTFVKINGSTLKSLEIGGNPSDKSYLRNLLQSIGQNCNRLESLTTFYDNDLIQELDGIFENCIYLKEIYLRLIKGILINTGEIFNSLSQTRNLKSIKFGNNIKISDHSLSLLSDTWLGPKPLFLSYSDHKQQFIGDSPVSILNRYEKLGFLKYKITDELPVNDDFYYDARVNNHYDSDSDDYPYDTDSYPQNYL